MEQTKKRELRQRSVVGKFNSGDIIKYWKECIKANNGYNLEWIVKPLPKDFSGSKFGHDTIRIEGSKDFVFYILSQHLSIFLKKFENHPVFEIQVFMNKLNPDYVSKPLNVQGEHFVLYLRVVEKSDDTLEL